MSKKAVANPPCAPTATEQNCDRRRASIAGQTNIVAADPGIDLAMLADLARYGSPPAEAAAVLGLTAPEFRAFLKTPEAAALWRKARAEGRALIRRAQFQLAEKNAQMAILLGRRHLGQKDPGNVSPERAAPSSGPPAPAVTIVVETGIDRSKERPVDDGASDPTERDRA